MFYSYKNCKVLINNEYCYAQDVSVLEQSSIEPGYIVGEKNNNNYLAENGIGGTLRISYLLTGRDPIADYMINEEDSINISFGGMSCLSGYLKSYSFNLTPNNPVVVSSEIVFFQNLTGFFTPEYETVVEKQCLNIADATVYALPGNQVGSLNNITRLSYQYAVPIEPQYLVGETVPTRVVAGPKDINVEFSYDITNSDLPVSGRNVNLQINFIHPTETNIRQSYGCYGILYQKQFDANTDSILTNTLSIRQNNLDKLNLSSDPSYNSVIPVVYFLDLNTGYYGTLINITGKNLSNINVIQYYGNVNTQNFQIVNDNHIRSYIPDGAKSGPMILVSDQGQATTETVYIGGLPITINALSFYTGEVGKNITISGENFYEISNVVFSSGTYANFNVINPILIQTTVPNNAQAGIIKVVSEKFNISGQSSFDFIPKPYISGFSPSSGFTGQSIYISGDCLSNVTGIKFNNLPSNGSATFSIIGNSGITVTIPSGNTNGYIKLYTRSGLTTLSNNSFYPYAGITGLFPLSGRTGSALRISGTNFIPELLYSSGNKYAISVNNATGYFDLIDNVLLTGLVPTGAKSGIVKIYSQNLDEYPSSFTFNVRRSFPTFSYFSPYSGASGSVLSVIGNNLADISRIVFTGNGTGIVINGNQVSTSFTENYINFTIPFISGGRYYDTIIETAEGNVTGSGIYVYGNAIVSGYSPTTGGVGSLISISGLNIYPYITQIWIDGSGSQGNINTGSYTYNNNSLQFYIPQNITSGNHRIIVYNSVSSGSGSVPFVFVPNPEISGFSPRTGYWGSGISVTGNYLDQVTSGFVSNVAISNFITILRTGITFTLPNNTSTDYIKLYNRYGYGVSNEKLIIQKPLPVITGFKPNPTYYGSGMIVSGEYLNTVVEIQFSGISTGISKFYNFSGIGTTGLYFNLPGGISSGYIRFVNDAGYTSSSQYLTLIPDAKISFVSSKSGEYDKSIYISGENLSGSIPYLSFLNSVNIKANNISYVGDSGLYFTIPHEITNGPIKLLSRNQNFVYDSGDFFVLPTISGISGILSYATGTFITITGINAYHNSGIFVSGNNGRYYKINTNEYTGNYLYLTGITGLHTGFSIITAKINTNFAGTGRLFLGSSYDYSLNQNVSGSVTQSLLNNIIFNTNVTISQPSPVLTYYFNTGSVSGSGITLSGNNLFSVNNIRFVSNQITGVGNITSYSNDTINVNIPNLETGTGLIFVISPFGTTTTGAFKFVPRLTISGYTPTQGHTGDYIRMTGIGLLSVTGISFGNTNASFIKYNELNMTVISGIVPSAFDCCGDTVTVCVYNEGSVSCL